MRTVPDTTTWGDRIKARRNELGLSRVDVAVAAEVTVSTVYRWEQSKNAPHRDTMIRVATALRTDPCVLFFADECQAA